MTLSERDALLIGGNHLAHQLVMRLGSDFYERFPETSAPNEVLEKLGSTVEFDIWCAWKAIMNYLAKY